MIKFYKIFLLLLFSIFALSAANASSVDAWVDDTRWWWNYNLSWTYVWLTWCWLSVAWWSDLYIENADNLSTAYIPEDTLGPATWWNYEVELKIFTDGMCDDLSESYTWFTDTMTLCVPNDWFSCGSASSTWSTSWWGWWRSRSSRMREEAAHIFANTWSIDSIELNLTKRIRFPNTLFELDWNYIGWDWAIKYEIQYSTGSDFQTTWLLDRYTSQIAIRRSYNIYVHDLDENSIIHYFRVRAFYKNKYSKRSNTVEYVNEDNPLSQYTVQCIDCTSPVSFNDIWQTPDLLIETEFNTSCDILWTCSSPKVKYNDILDNIFYVPAPIYYNISR